MSRASSLGDMPWVLQRGDSGGGIGLVLPGLGIGLAVAGVIGLGLYYFQHTIAENVVRASGTLRTSCRRLLIHSSPLQVKNQGLSAAESTPSRLSRG